MQKLESDWAQAYFYFFTIRATYYAARYSI